MLQNPKQRQLFDEYIDLLILEKFSMTTNGLSEDYVHATNLNEYCIWALLNIAIFYVKRQQRFLNVVKNL